MAYYFKKYFFNSKPHKYAKVPNFFTEHLFLKTNKQRFEEMKTVTDA